MHSAVVGCILFVSDQSIVASVSRSTGWFGLRARITKTFEQNMRLLCQSDVYSWIMLFIEYLGVVDRYPCHGS